MLTRHTKNAVISIAGFLGYAQKLYDNDFKYARRSVKALVNHADKVLTALMEDMTAEEQAACMRFANSSELIVLPQGDPRVKKEYYVVPVDAFHELMDDVISDCAFCDKTGREIKRCPRRRALVAAGVVPAGSSDKCDFMEGVEI